MLNSPNMYEESNRLKTFVNWPSTAVTPEDLAKAGFYYLNEKDLVKCAFCGVKLSSWKPTDTPISEHARASSNCPHIKGTDVCGFMERLPRQNTKQNISPVKITPSVHPEFSLMETRLRSFGDWPKSLKQKPNELASSGFFYLGVGDQTKCFQCGLGLKDWEDGDDVWEEHARWSPECSYLLLRKGDDFVEQIQVKFSATATNCKETQIEENKNEERNSSDLCKICYKNELEVVLIPCRHIVSCVDCSFNLKNVCPVCRKRFDNAIRAFLS